MSEVPPATSVEEVLELYRRWAAEHYDEELSQLDHALQTAAAAEAEGAGDALVAAALLHDVGHLLDLRAGSGSATTDRDLRHEASGAAWLAALFPASVTAPIALHVRAKRYRCGTDEGYLATLSDGSTRSLDRQGGPLTRQESLAFETNPNFQAAVRLRTWDDAGKVEGRAVPPFDHYTELLGRLAR